VLLPDVYADHGEGDRGMESFLRYRNDVLLPTMNAKQAAAMFDKTGSEALAVVNDLVENRPIGLLSESHTLRRYSEELDQRRREVSGEL